MKVSKLAKELLQNAVELQLDLGNQLIVLAENLTSIATALQKEIKEMKVDEE